MSAKILPFAEWQEVMRKARKPAENATVIAAAENARLVERLAERNREAMDKLDELPSDSEPA